MIVYVFVDVQKFVIFFFLSWFEFCDISFLSVVFVFLMIFFLFRVTVTLCAVSEMRLNVDERRRTFACIV